MKTKNWFIPMLALNISLLIVIVFLVYERQTSSNISVSNDFYSRDKLTSSHNHVSTQPSTSIVDNSTTSVLDNSSTSPTININATHDFENISSTTPTFTIDIDISTTNEFENISIATSTSIINENSTSIDNNHTNDHNDPESTTTNEIDIVTLPDDDTTSEPTTSLIAPEEPITQATEANIISCPVPNLLVETETTNSSCDRNSTYLWRIQSSQDGKVDGFLFGTARIPAYLVLDSLSLIEHTAFWISEEVYSEMMVKNESMEKSWNCTLLPDNQQLDISPYLAKRVDEYFEWIANMTGTKNAVNWRQFRPFYLTESLSYYLHDLMLIRPSGENGRILDMFIM